MNDLWTVEKGYIDAAASCEAAKMGAIIVTLMVVMSFFYGVNICVTASKIERLEQRVEAIEKEGGR